MASVQTLARPYARAAFTFAKDGNALAEWSRKLSFAAAVAEAPAAQTLIGNPRFSTVDLAKLVMPQGESSESDFARFVLLLADSRRLATLAEIATQFDALKHEYERVLKVSVRTAAALETPQAEALKLGLKRRFDREIELVNIIDPGVIGGAVIDADGIVIDGSVRGKLASLETALTY